ncbi:MAG: hypothetical protein LBN39_00410 [Planctomycetaceae bacterium]|nr:hypothetical protein [Planctomycetaceae bacterium]
MISEFGDGSTLWYGSITASNAGSGFAPDKAITINSITSTLTRADGTVEWSNILVGGLESGFLFDYTGETAYIHSNTNVHGLSLWDGDVLDFHIDYTKLKNAGNLTLTLEGVIGIGTIGGDIPDGTTPEPATMLIFGTAAAIGLPLLRRRMKK